jgi:hypothetical protein
MELLTALLVSPGTIVGFIIGLYIPLACEWRPNVFLWLLALLLNVPTLQILYLGNVSPVPSTVFADTILVYFLGTGGLGLGLTLWLVIPKAARAVQVVWSASFGRARRSG